MKRIFILTLIALMGISAAMYAVWQGNQPVSVKSQGLPQFTPPFQTYAAGSGLVEAATRNIPVGSTVSGVVTRLYVKVGDRIKSGDPLFSVDDRNLQAQLLTAHAKIKVARATYTRSQHHVDAARRLTKMDSGAISKESYQDKTDELAQKAAALALAEARVKQLKADIERYTVRALMPGVILQCRMRPGEYIEATSLAKPLMIMGGDRPLNLRVDIDEQDAWRIVKKADAVAYVRGHPELTVPLHYEYTEPYIVPKTALTGLSTERTDARVLQVVYRLEPTDFPLYIGQQLDVFIQTAEPVAPKKGH